MSEITRYRGDTAPDRFNVKDSDGTALNITGHTFSMTVDSRLNPPDGTTVLYTLVGTIVDAPNGIVEFTPSGLNADQVPCRYYYDVQMTAGASIITLAKDVYTYTQDITK